MSKSTNRARRPWRLWEVLLVTVPPFALVLWVLLASVLDYHRVTQFEDWWSARAQTARFVKLRLLAALHLPRALQLDRRLSAEDERQGKLELFVDRRAWDSIQCDATLHLGDGIPAEVVYGNELLPVELRLRGDNSAHWTTEKKTLRVRAKRDALFKGRRDLVFSVKEVLAQHVSATLARANGLLAPESEIVPVFMNQRFYGLSRSYAPVDEGFLRRQGRMPGNVFRGDTAERGEYFKGLPRDLFKNPMIWDRVALNERPGAPGGALQEWLVDMNGTTFADHQRFMAWLDRDEISRLLALLLAVGDPYHMSGVHNQLWYEDPSDGTLHPIVWDLRVLDLARPLPGAHFNRFWQKALRDPRVMAGALAYLQRWNGDGHLMALARSTCAEAVAAHRDAFEFESLREDVVPEIGRPEDVLGDIERNLFELARRCGDARVALSVARTDAGFVVDLELRGWAGVRLASVTAQGSGPWSLAPDVDESGTHEASEPRLNFDAPGRERVDSPFAVQLPGAKVGRVLGTEPLHYRWFVLGESLESVEFELVNVITGAPATVEPWSGGAPIAAGSSWHTWALQRADARSITRIEWSGERLVEDDYHVPRGTTLAIAPGTHLRLAPDASLLIEGKLEALGEPDAPIVIEQAEPGRPWGVVALQGPGANHSRLQHTVIRGGGGGLEGRVEYKGSVCVHRADPVVFDHCTIASNMRCDDLINAVNARVDLLACEFRGANADSVDYDISGGIIRDCNVVGSGNDGFDLMTANPWILGNTITGSADKGVSVGEGAAPLLLDNEITGCNRGIQVKDRSEPLVVHCEIRDCKTGVMANLKNWRYGGGGRPRLVRTLVTGNGVELDLDPVSRITVHQSVVGALDPEEPASATAAGTLDWLALPHGFALNRAVAGLVPSWELRPPVGLVDQGVFHDDFASPYPEWRVEGGGRRVWKRGGELGASFRGRGRLVNSHEWDLSDPAHSYQLVLEIAATELLSVRAAALLEDGRAGELVPCALGQTPQEFDYTVLELAPGRYTGFVLDVESVRSGGVLTIASWSLVATEAVPR